MWTNPWKLKEGFTIGSGLVLTGLLLQFTVGPVLWDTFAWPVNIITLAVIVAMLVLASLFYKKVYVFRFLTTYHAAIPAIVFAVILTTLMGITRQNPAPMSDDWLGMHNALSFWPFVLIYLWIAVIVGLTTVKQILHFRLSHWPAIISHCGLLLAMVCGTLGSADMQRLKMYCEKGQPEWRALDNANKTHELDLAIQLDSFIIDEYPPKVTLVDNKTNEAKMLNGKPISLLLDDKFKEGDIEGWHIKLVQVLDMAAPKMTADSTTYVYWPIEGAVSAARLEVTKKGSNKVIDGWISDDSYALPGQLMKLDEKYSLGMPQREPQRFCSMVEIVTKQGDNVETMIEVNKPYTINGWKIYQYSYNEKMGRWSDYSVLELVSDPWLPAVYVGIGMLFLGALGMFFTRRESLTPGPSPLGVGSENSKD